MQIKSRNPHHLDCDFFLTGKSSINIICNNFYMDHISSVLLIKAPGAHYWDSYFRNSVYCDIYFLLLITIPFPLLEPLADSVIARYVPARLQSAPVQWLLYLQILT